MAYTPPATNAINFDLGVYTAPAVNAINFDVDPKVALVSKDIAMSAPVMDKPTVGQVQAFVSKAIDLPAPAVAKSTIGQTQVLVSKAINLPSPIIEKPTAGIVVATDSLTALDITLSSMGIGKPVIGQKHALTSSDITLSAPIMDKSAIGQVHWLAAKDIVTIPVIEKPVIAQTHVLISSDLVMTAMLIEGATLRIRRTTNIPATVISPTAGNIIYAKSLAIDVSGTRAIKAPANTAVEIDKVVI